MVALIVTGSTFALHADNLVSSISTIMVSRSSASLGAVHSFDVSNHARATSLLSGIETEWSERDVIQEGEIYEFQKRKIPNNPKVNGKEATAMARIVRWIGGQDKYRKLEEDMETAFRAAETSLSSRGIEMGSLDVIGVIDFTKPSYVKRMLIYHPKTGKESRHLVAHGSKSGKVYAKRFSNRVGSHQSSPGLYRIGRRYRGSHGASLRLHGLDDGINDNALRRAIVLHSAWYVSYQAMVTNLSKEGAPRLGCSRGCPAVSQNDLSLVLHKLTPGSYLYIHTDS